MKLIDYFTVSTNTYFAVTCFCRARYEGPNIHGEVAISGAPLYKCTIATYIYICGIILSILCNNMRFSSIRCCKLKYFISICRVSIVEQPLVRSTFTGQYKICAEWGGSHGSTFKSKMHN